ncbi:hypothetical protein L484_010607 [Morus notabilis]|uniref:Uncharacterized protein n=1 Tax=Morus notabilis TaxID=981085 RepID=W9QNK8_9ROSA|nr:hypothetical protein L484_010607 [Morus notabilis]
MTRAREENDKLPGSPLSIERSLSTFYVALRNTEIISPASGPPRPRLGRPLTVVPLALEFKGCGKIIRTVNLSTYYGNATVTQFQKELGEYYVGYLDAKFIGKFDD